MSDSTTDVVVIGAGMAGASAGYEISDHASVVMLEAEGEMPVHTTGRSAAMLIAGYGSPVVQSLTAASKADFDRLETVLETAPLTIPRPVIYIAEPDVADQLDRLLDLPGVEEISVEAALEFFPALVPSVLERAAHGHGGTDLDVMALYDGYVRGLKHRGGTVRRRSRMTSATKVTGGWEVETEAGMISCGSVVNTAGAWGDDVAIKAGVEPVGLQPMRRTAFTAPVDPPAGFHSWAFIMDAAERYYARPEGGALLGSAAEEEPAPPGDPRVDDLRVAMALDALQRVTTFPLRTVQSQWVGLRTFAPDRSPVVGESEAGSGFWWSVGQGGYGIQMAPALARTLAALHSGSEVPADVAATGLSRAQLGPDRFNR